MIQINLDLYDSNCHLCKQSIAKAEAMGKELMKEPSDIPQTKGIALIIVRDGWARSRFHIDDAQSVTFNEKSRKWELSED
jgi:hypothetical protein